MSTAAHDAEMEGQPTGDIASQQIAAVYAKAFLGAVEAAGDTDAALAELDSFVTDVLDKLPRLESILSSAIVSADDKIALLDKAIGRQASVLFLNLLKVLARHGRLDVVREVRGAAHSLVDKMRSRFRVHVASAAEFDGGLRQRLSDMLRGMLGGEPVLEISIRPELIGGIVCRVGDTVYDGSIATRLERMREQMIHRSVHEIQSRRDRFSSAEGN